MKNHIKNRRIDLQNSRYFLNKRGIIIPIHSLLSSLFLYLLLPVSSGAQSYCWPNVQIACFYGDLITNVSFGTINHSESVCNSDPDGKKDFTGTVPAATITPGNTYTLTIGLNVNSSGGARAWIDFNGNSVFEAGESFSLGSRTSNGNLSLAITIPPGASTGPSRIRITNRKDNVNAMPGPGDACHSLSSYRGQIKDYALYISGTNPLPVELITFSALAQDSRVLLNWVTASEKDHACFTTERSTDGITWEAFGQIQGKGNSDRRQDYHLEDQAPLPGINYYRLKQTNHDRSYCYSQTVSADFKPSPADELYPNPFNETIIIKTGAKITEAALYNNQGEMMSTPVYHNEENAASLDTSNLPKGIYFLTINQKRYKFIKN